MIVERQEVVVVAAHFPRRNTERRGRQPGHHQRPLRQQRHLDLVRDAELLFEPLLLGRLPQQILDARRHRVERLRPARRADRCAVIGDLVREIALPHALGAGEQLVHRSGDRARQREADHERNAFDDEEQPADHDQQDEQECLAEVAFADRQPCAAEMRS